MNEQGLTDFVLIDISTILIEDRSRDVDQDWVTVLAAMFKATEMQHPVTVWNSDRGPRLVSGAHRIGAYTLNGETMIPARYSKAATLAEAKILEITENIGRRELNALDRAQHLFDLKAAYESMHPETKAGVAGALAKHGSAKGIIPFADDAAEKIGLSNSAITKSVAMWTGLSEATKFTARGTWLADHQAGLMQLAKATDAKQAKALALIFPTDGKQAKATNVADALHILENGRLFNSVEKRFAGINKTLRNLQDAELDAVLVANEQRIMEWVERRIGGEK